MLKSLLGWRKFIVAMAALIAGTVIALRCDAAVVGAFGMMVSAIVGTYMGANAVADSKWGRPQP